MNANTWKKAMPVLLTALSCGGVVLTAVLAKNAGAKAETLMQTLKQEKAEEPTKKEVLKVTWKCYIPVAAAGLGTMACMIGVAVLSRKQQASLMSAYALCDGAFRKYRGKITDIFGEDADKQVRDAIAREVYETQPANLSAPSLTGETYGAEMICPSDEKRLFFDETTQRYFESTVPNVMAAEYHLNRNLALGGEISLNDYCEFFGMPETEEGETLGWSVSDEYFWMDFDHREVTLTEDDLECIVISCIFGPDPDYRNR